MKNMGHRLMFSVVVLCVSAYLTYAEECLAGMQKRGDICCKPVTCKKNEDYRLCNHTHREDSCVPCPSNTFNQHSIDTSHQFYYEKQQPNICKNHEEICVKTACPEEDKDYRLCNEINRRDRCIPCPPNTTNQDIIDTGLLDEQIPGICRKIDCNPEVRCPPGGMVEKCKPGYFKDSEGYGPCSKHRECLNGEIITFNGTSTMDTQCSTPNATQSTTQSTTTSDVNSTAGNSLSTKTHNTTQNTKISVVNSTNGKSFTPTSDDGF